MSAQQSIPVAAPPDPTTLEVTGFGGTTVCINRLTPIVGRSRWWIGIYCHSVCMASCVGAAGGALRFNDEDGQHEVVVDATFVRLPQASWLQLKSWAEALAADSGRGEA